MHYIPTTGWEDGTADLAKCLIDELSSGKCILWLLSGGSNIEASVKVMDLITTENSKNLTVGLIDERYGPVGHADSNWHQLEKKGFKPKAAHCMPILADGLTRDEAADAYNLQLGQIWGTQDKVLMQLGIGADGHIAGILPHSPATNEHERLVSGYTGKDYERITITPHAFEQKATAVLFAFGESKKTAMHNLQHRNIDPAEQPAQLLKSLTNVYIYSDQLGESS